MATDLKRVKEIFLEAAELPDEAARAVYLDQACEGDAGLRARVEALLRSHDPDGSFLGTPAAVVPDPDHAPTRSFTPEPGHPASQSSNGTPLPDDEVPLGFLDPPTRADSLGRIGHYEVLQVLGQGGFGIVFRAFDEVLQRVVAVKVLAPQLAATSPARKRFLREARTSAAVRHENVVQVYEVGEQPLPYLVMEFIPGETLQQRLNRTGPLEALEVVRIARQIAEGLTAAHATDLIHRDIKPGNILMEGGTQRVKITDFGLARAADDASISQSGIIAGTPMYMAPEQAKGEKLDQRADLFSLGSVLYQMASGRPPFRANSTIAVLKRVAEDAPRDIREIIPETPQWLCNIIAKLHAKNPDDRYQSAREVADVLEDCEEQLKTNSKLKDLSRIPVSSFTPPRSGLRSRQLVGVALAVIAVFGIAVWGNLVSKIKKSFYHELTVQLPDTATVVEFRETSDTFERENRWTFSGDWPLEPTATVANTREKTLRLPPANYYMFVTKDGKRVERRLLKIGWGGSQTLTVSPVSSNDSVAAVENPPTDGFVQLFNGKDLKGWKVHSSHPGKWTVENGILVGREKPGYLFTQRGDYKDFHLRAEVKLSNTGNGGLGFRNEFGFDIDRRNIDWNSPSPIGYTVELAAKEELGTAVPAGSLHRIPRSKDIKLRTTVLPKSDEVKADQWFTLEVIAREDRFTIAIDGKTMVDFFDPFPFNRPGHLSLQVLARETEVQFRKIEIKELPTEEPGFVQLFNGKDLTGWEPGKKAGTEWTVEDSAIVGKKAPGYLFTTKFYENFHVKLEAKISAGGNSGVSFRGGYQAELRNDPLCPTGSIIRVDPANTDIVARYPRPPVPADQWFTLEIRTVGKSLSTRVNDGPWITAVDDRPEQDRRAPLSLETGTDTTVRFRKIEIKELPAK